MLNWRRAGRGAIGAALAWAMIAAQAGAGQVPVPVPRPAMEAATTSAVVFKKAPAATSGPGSAGMVVMPSITPRHSGKVGWVLMDLDSGVVLDAQGADLAFAPASVAKLPTAFYALDRLGPNFRFETRVAVTGPIRNETLEGDLILVGGGDPELDSDALLPLVTQVREKGFRHVRGQFLVDGSIGPRRLGIADDQPEDAAYNPAVSGLNLNYNRVRLKWDARSQAKVIRVSAMGERLDPDISGVRVTVSDYLDAPMFTHLLDGQTEVWRMNQQGFRGEGARWLPVRQPELYCGEVFQRLAQEAGVAMSPAAEGVLPEDAEVIATHESRHLAKMLRSMLQYSTNLTAEMIGLAAGRAGGEAPASLVESAAAMNAWAAAYGGFPAGDQGFQLVNHSGLATDSRLSPRRMAELLVAAARDYPEGGKRYPRLPGIAEVLRSYNVAVKSVKMDYKHLDIAAKTGTMDYVRGLAGYIATPKGRRLAFAIFSNDIERRPNDPIRSVDKRWMAQARDFERSLIRAWVRTLDG